MEVTVERRTLREMLNFAQDRYPREAILILRGNASRDGVEITEYLFPPMGWGDPRFAGFPLHMLPMDLSYMGTMHSHPSGDNHPSVTDVHNMFGRVMLIAGYPFKIENVAAYRKDGEGIPLRVV